jgi:hypothetical protein
MAKLFRWWVVVIFFGVLAPVGLHAEDDAAAIHRILSQQESDWNRGDIESFLHGYKDSPETTFIGRNVRKGYQSVLESYRKNYSSKQEMGQLTFSELEVQLLPTECGVKYAVVTGHYHLARSAASGGDAGGVFDLLWEKTKAGWRIILDHTS